MRFRETDALLREAESRDNLAAALKDGKAAKEFRKEREALEMVVGGRKRLDEADKILSAAVKTRAEAVRIGKEEASRLSSEAQTSIKVAREEFAGKELELIAAQEKLIEQQRSFGLKVMERDNAALAVQGREKAADDRSAELDSRETKIAGREKEASAREAEIKRYDDWRAAAPA